MSEKSKEISKLFLKVDIVAIFLMQTAYLCPFLIVTVYYGLDEIDDSRQGDMAIKT